MCPGLKYFFLSPLVLSYQSPFCSDRIALCSDRMEHVSPSTPPELKPLFCQTSSIRKSILSLKMHSRKRLLITRRHAQASVKDFKLALRWFLAILLKKRPLDSHGFTVRSVTTFPAPCTDMCRQISAQRREKVQLPKLTIPAQGCWRDQISS